MEGLGGWFIAMTPWAWRKVPPHCKDKQTEDRIAKREHPAWSFVVQQLLEPMLDKATAVCCSLSLPTQPHFKRGERTSDAKPCLCCDERDGAQVRKPEPQVVDPAPIAQIADDDEHEANDNECNNCGMQRERDIRKQLIR